MDGSLALWILAALLVAVGVFGVLLPVVPGPLLVASGLVLAAWIDDFAYVGRGTLVVLALLTLLAHAVDFAAAALGAKRVGAHRRALVGAVLGAGIGIFFGLPGVVLGPFVGAALGELSVRGGLERAGRVGVATWIGMALGGAAKLALMLCMIALFAFQRFVAP